MKCALFTVIYNSVMFNIPLPWSEIVFIIIICRSVNCQINVNFVQYRIKLSHT